MSGQQPKGKVIMESISCREAAARLVLGASGVKEMHSVSGVQNGSVTLMAAPGPAQEGQGRRGGPQRLCEGWLGVGDEKTVSTRIEGGGSCCGGALECGRIGGAMRRSDPPLWAHRWAEDEDA